MGDTNNSNNNNENHTNNSNTYLSQIYKSINNYFFNSNNNKNQNENLNNKDSASNNFNDHNENITSSNATSNSSSILDHDNVGLISNIKSIIKDDKSVTSNSYNLKPLGNYELDEDIIRKQAGTSNDTTNTTNTSNSTSTSSSSSSHSSSSGVSGIINNVSNTITNTIVNAANNVLEEAEQQEQQEQQNQSNNDNNVQSKTQTIKSLIKSKQKETATKIKQINDVMNDETLDEDTIITKTIDILGKKRFYEILFLLGSASIISFALRTMYFGKTIRAIEIPDGNLTTLIVRSNSVKRLKKTILQNQPPIYPGVELSDEDIKASAFIDPHFTEPIVSNKDVRRLEDGGYLLWTKSDFEIPRTAVGLKSLMKDKDLLNEHIKNAEVDKLIRLISLFGPSLILKPPSTLKLLLLKYQFITPTEQDRIIMDTTEPLSIKERDELISIVISNSNDREQIFNLYHKYHNDVIQFKQNLKKWIKTKLSLSTNQSPI
ncbi:hypothetical protein DDB_G0290201 [Dictyostelium discoideum AX4]|uniref:Uncharacterized protein n=1 Tax=Dictyostelium discoideum TaxID=44689 RepID=Q54GF1_DICDI|nr:hypothetical protein DDB_G0290201 [Dictyostelium discoideum AX4]EAL62322.1 hypothetical protein DDB_G0290201 [Dictyostelium discoideum AX4]|eukprot:XP_635827.1 hypothetical protein DDB_G0290201 [Dictyostelium discoideum AX4]